MEDRNVEGKGAGALRVCSAYIVGPIYDGLFFIFAPLLAIGAWLLVSNRWLTIPNEGGVTVAQNEAFWGFIVFAIFTEGHLVLAFFRSHLNRSVFRQFPVRFTLVPVIVFLAGLASSWALLALAVLETWWDVYHSSMQTFGFSRIYDAKAGNPPDVGRRLDFWLNIVIYTGPLVAGASLLAHFQPLEQFALLDAVFLPQVPVHVESHLGAISRIGMLSSCAFLVYYAVAMARLVKNGYAVSIQKVLLLLSTAATSIYAWYFSSFVVAFFTINLFHAVQYYALIYANERQNLVRVFHLDRMTFAKVFVMAIILAVGANFGFMAAGAERTLDATSRWPWALAVTVALMHFWYDGFMWSVRKNQVAA